MPEQPLVVAVDARCLNVDHVRGMGKSLYEFIRRTASTGAIEWHLLSNRPDLPMHAPDDSCRVSVFETKGYRLHAWEQFSLPREAKRRGADVLHAAGLTAPWWQPVPTVVTLHDMIPWQRYDPAWPAGFHRDRVLPAAYRRAAAIITVSDTSRRDILARWPALKPKLHVVSPGVDERYLEAAPDRRPLVIGNRTITEPYLLYLGGGDPRKRLMWALQAWWTGAGAAATMVVCGLEKAAHEQARASVPHHLRDRLVLAPFVDEDDMPRLYMRAAAVLYPSLYEGFGMPVIEAQAVGTRLFHRRNRRVHLVPVGLPGGFEMINFRTRAGDTGDLASFLEHHHGRDAADVPGRGSVGVRLGIELGQLHAGRHGSA